MPRSHLLDWSLIAAVAFFGHLPVREYQSVIPSTATDVSKANEILHKFVDDIAKPGAPPHPWIYFNYSPISYFDFGIYYYLRTDRFPGSMAAPLSADPKPIQDGVRQADYAIVFDPGAATRADDNKYRVLMGETADAVLGMGDLTEIERIPYSDGSYVLFRVQKDTPSASPSGGTGL
jgi:hypothetical protein